MNSPAEATEHEGDWYVSFTEDGELCTVMLNCQVGAQKIVEMLNKLSEECQARKNFEENTVGVLKEWQKDYNGEKERGDKWRMDAEKAEAACLKLRGANIQLLSALDMIREALKGSNVQDLLLIINRAIFAARE